MCRGTKAPGVCQYGAFRLLGLGEKEPVPPSGSEADIAPLQRFDDRHAVQDGQMGDSLGMVYGRAKGGVAAAVMSHNGKAVEPKLPHQGDTIGGLGAL